MLHDEAEAPCASPARFRECVSRFATGVAIVSCLDEQELPHGMTVSSFTSISLQPATVLVSLRPGRTHASIRHRGCYGVSVLAGEQEDWSRHFGGRPLDAPELHWEMKGSVPVLRDALAWFECEVDHMMQVHDHTLFVARVLDCDHRRGAPLMFFESRFHQALQAPAAGARRKLVGRAGLEPATKGL